MELAPGVFLNSGRLESLRDPAVLFIESNPDVLEALPHTLGRALPDVTIDGCASAERGLLLMNSGRYHAVVSDMRSAEADDYSLLKGAEALSCPIPLLLSAKGSDAQALKRALGRGAFDVIRNPSREIEASETISRALWFYRLRLTIYHRRQRLNEYRRKKKRSYDSVAEQEDISQRISEQRRQIIEKAHTGHGANQSPVRAYDSADRYQSPDVGADFSPIRIAHQKLRRADCAFVGVPTVALSVHGSRVELLRAAVIAGTRRGYRRARPAFRRPSTCPAMSAWG